MLPTLTSRTADKQTTLILDYTSLLDPLIRTIATERAGDQDVDRDLDHIADLAGIVSRAEDPDEREPIAAELDFRVDQFLDSLGYGRRELATQPRPWAVGSARAMAANLRGMADRIAEWADRLDAQPEPAAA
ncbi:hypothetical protein OG455_27730 [Kitasatospora sp. NBC_01287]|uniref:hypothetical protein n=1 Tax=Kitasatospora sp. NBC_01287 TaxID=2903573 RepID=UPI002253EDE8|nr:hypothetical protein [Kitasatospora sp. NBC_01287]MCX4749252.1 hypothetical protein [Kitasatospora sp. NBC_01287]